MATRMLQRRGTAAEWAAANPVLGNGELGFTTDTRIVKIGDGVTAWNALTADFLTRSIMDATGDLIVGSGADSVARLARGATGQVLAVKADGTLEWVNPYAVVDAAEDLIVATGADTVKRLAKGSVGHRLTISAAGAVAWEALPAATNPFTAIDALGDILVGSGPDAVARLAKGANGTVLTIDGSGNVTWAAASATDSTKVAKTGDTMTGILNLSGTGSNSVLILTKSDSANATKRFRISATGELEIINNANTNVVAKVSDAGRIDGTSLYDGGNRVYSESNPPPVSGMVVLATNNLVWPKNVAHNANGWYDIVSASAGSSSVNFVAPASGKVKCTLRVNGYISAAANQASNIGIRITQLNSAGAALPEHSVQLDYESGYGISGGAVASFGYSGLTPGATYTAQYTYKAWSNYGSGGQELMTTAAGNAYGTVALVIEG